MIRVLPVELSYDCGLWTSVNDNWEGNKRLGKDFLCGVLGVKIKQYKFS